jgi:hypothetical protein
MARKRYTPETIIRTQREAEVLQGQGKSIAEVVKQPGITDQTFYRWRTEYGGMRVDQTKRLKVPYKQPKRRRLWLNDGSYIRLSPQGRNHVWSWDFVFDRTRDGRSLKLMVVMDEFTRRCLAIHVARRIRSKEALEVFADLIVEHGVPEYIRSDNGGRWLLRNYAIGCSIWEQKLRTSRRAAHGKTVTASRSMADCRMNCSTGRSSTP